MSKQERVLAYKKAKELTNNDLMNISGGASKLTVERTQKISLSVSGGSNDVEFDQIWD